MRIPQRLLKTSNAFIIGSVVLLCVLALLFQYRWIKENQFLFGSKYSRARIPCPLCNTTGLMPSTNDQSTFTFCPQCLGIGGHYIKRIDDHDSICPVCGGMGRIRDGENQPFRYCKRCDGRGLVRSKTPIADR